MFYGEKKLQRWKSFHTTAGRDDCDNFQVCQQGVSLKLSALIFSHTQFQSGTSMSDKDCDEFANNTQMKIQIKYMVMVFEISG